MKRVPVKRLLTYDNCAVSPLKVLVIIFTGYIYALSVFTQRTSTLE